MAQVESKESNVFRYCRVTIDRACSLTLPSPYSSQHRGKMVDGRLQKYAASRALLEQPFIRNTDLSVAEHLKGVAAKLGENIQVRRFIR